MKMIALVSDQRMQNVIPLFQQDADFRELTLVLSKDRHTGKPLQKYIQSANNISGGTKPMAISALQAVQAYEGN